MRLSTNQFYFARIVKNKMVKCPMILLVLMVGVKAETVSNEITQLSTLNEPYDYHDIEVHIEPSVDTSADEDKLRKLKNIAKNMENKIEQLNEDLENFRGIESIKKALKDKVSAISAIPFESQANIDQLLLMDGSPEAGERQKMLKRMRKRTTMMKRMVEKLTIFTVVVKTMKLLQDEEQIPEFQKILQEMIND